MFVKRASAAFTTALLVAVLTTGASPAPTIRDRLPLVGPRAIIDCGDLSPVSGEHSGQPGPGFVTFRVRHGVLSARLVLDRAKPDTRYIVRLIQEDRDCHRFDGVLRTDGQGNGDLRVSEPAVTHRAQIIVDTGIEYGRPTYRARSLFFHPMR